MGSHQVSPRKGRSRRIGGPVVALIAAFSITILGLPAGISFGQEAEPEIQLLNPSSFADSGPMEDTPVVSEAAPDDCTDEDHCDSGNYYRLSAWTANPPVGSSVVFVAIQGILEFEVSATETVSGTWEAEWNMPPEIQEGLPGTIQAFIVVGNAPVASDEESVTFSHAQDNAHFGYPASGQPFGLFGPLQSTLPDEEDSPARKEPRAGLDVSFTNSPQIVYMRAFYTTSVSGTEPEWKQCAEEGFNAFSGGIRCILEEESEQSLVTALAVVTNDTQDPIGDYDPRFNASGDVVRPSEIYVQEPGALNSTAQGVQKVATQGSCSVAASFELLDTRGNEIVGANLDYHALGPDDRLTFNNIATPIIGGQGSVPDRDSAHSVEEAWDCTTTDPRAQNPANQGEHQRFGAPDIKHLEGNAGGTNDQGLASFRLRSPVQGNTFWSAWVDEAPDEFLTNNDAYDSGELCVNGSVGWVVDAPAPSATEPLACNPAPLPSSTASPSPSPTGEPSGDRSITLESNKSRIRKGRSVRFVGEITASEIPACESSERVKLKAKRPGTRRFRSVAQAQTNSEGTYRIVLRPKRTKIYRAIALPNAPCKRARSNTVKVRVRNAS